MQDFSNRRYEIEAEIGRGGMGIVYRALDRLVGQKIAIKRVGTSAEDLIYGSWTKSVDRRLSLAQEFQTLASLWHPNIIRVLDYGFDAENPPYFSMDLLEEPQRITDYGKTLPQEQKIHLIWQILLALKYLHRRGVLHRDLKPGNILVSKGEIKVLDFGLAVALNEKQKSNSTTSGTLAYMAPEVFSGLPASEASDLYAVGVIAFELLTGRHPFHVEDPAKLMHDLVYSVPDFSTFGETPLELVSIIQRLMLKPPDDRFHSTDEVLAAFSQATSHALKAETQEIRESFLVASKFVGRSPELTQLIEMLSEMQYSRGGVWLIGGESGVGKSRLMSEIRTQALVRGIQVVRGQEISEGGKLYQLWHDVFKLMCLFTPLTDAQYGVLKAVIPELEQLLERDIPDAPSLPPNANQQRFINVVVDLFKAQREPMLVILEDIHWSTVSLDVLKALFEPLARLPVLILATYRDDERAELPALLNRAKVIKLNRLSKDAMADLSTSMLGQSGHFPEMIDFLQRETEGNVFFAVEIVRALAEEAGEIEKIGTTVRPTQITARGIQQIIRRRLARVPTEAYGLLQMAAVFGRRIDESLLTAAEPSVDLSAWLVDCANAAIIRIDDEAWTFSHDKLRETLLAELSPAQHIPLHQKAAELLETIHPDQAARLAYHWQMAARTERELHYRIIAAKEAHQNGAVIDAIRHYQRAIALVAAELDSPDRVSRELDLQLDLGANLLAGEGYGSSAVFDTYERARYLCQQLGATPQFFKVLSGLQVYYVLRAKLQSASDLADQAIEMAKQAQDSSLFLEAYRMRAAAKFWSGNFVVGNEYMNKCYGVYDPIKHRPNIMIYGQDSGVCVLANGGWLDWFMGYPDLARQTCLKGISLAEGIGHDFSLCFALSFLNYLYIYLGEPDALGESSERLARVARASDIKAYGLNAVVHRGWYAVMQGNYDEGMNAFQQALKTYEIVGSLLHIPLLMNLIAETYLRMDKIEEGLKTTESAFERLSSIETRAFMPELYRIRGELLLKSPTHTRTEGIAALEKALNMAQDMSAKSLELRAAMSLYRAQGETAHPLLASVYNWFTEGLDTTDLVAARTLLTNGKT